MSTVTVDLKGLRNLHSALLELPDRVAKRALAKGTSEGARVIRDAARDRAPVYTGDPQAGHPPPGTLKRSIFIKRARDSTPTRAHYEVFCRMAYNYNLKSGMRGVQAYGRFDAFYARWVEYGTAKMGPRPFMRPAFSSKWKDAATTITNALQAAVSAEAQAAPKGN
jgi:HK97 gp10 family phage protein